MLLSGIQVSKYQLNFHRTNGQVVATKKDQNNKEPEINLGKISIGNIIPTKILFEKSGDGNRSNPKNSPIKIDITASFSLKCFL